MRLEHARHSILKDKFWNSTFLGYIFIGLPILSLILNAVSWLKYGLNLPFLDDWRQYADGGMGRLDLQYLMTPANDTLSPVGLSLDSLAVRYLSGNGIAYQFLSMVLVLGSLTYLQWRLICFCTDNKIIRALSFSLTLLMLQPDNYWGLQNLAYHQAIPLVCLLGVLCVTFSKTWARGWAIPTLFVLALISGFSYTSGAFAMLGASLVAIVMQFFVIAADDNSRIRTTGWTLLPPSLIATAAQVWVIVGFQHGIHNKSVPMALPWESDFWLYLMGKVARSLLLPINQPVLSFSVSLLLVATILCVLCYVALELYKRKLEPQQVRFTLIFATLICAIALYLFLVAAGRTHFRPDSIHEPMQVFTFGFLRFHYFWATLIWPWLALALLTFIHKKWLNEKQLVGLSFCWLVAIIVAVSLTSVMRHDSFHKNIANIRTEGIKCIISQMQNNDKVLCPRIHPADLAKPLANARQVDSSFLRNLPYYPIALGTNQPAPLFRLTEKTHDIQLVNAQLVAKGKDNSIEVSAGTDPMLIISINNPGMMSRCISLEVNALITSSKTDLAQLFFTPAKEGGFSQKNSTTVPVLGNSKPQLISFTINSPSGLIDKVRFDPVTTPQSLTIHEVEVRCRAAL